MPPPHPTSREGRPPDRLDSAQGPTPTVTTALSPRCPHPSTARAKYCTLPVASAGTVVSSWQIWAPSADGRFVRPAPPPPRARTEVPSALWCGWRYNEMLFDCELLTTCVMLRADTVRQVGLFDTQLWNGDDYDYWLRASRVAPMAKLARPGALYRALPNSVSRKPRTVNAELDVLNSALARWGATGPDGRVTLPSALQERIDQLVMSHGWLHLHRGDAGVALSAFRQLLRRNPVRPRESFTPALRRTRQFPRPVRNDFLVAQERAP